MISRPYSLRRHQKSISTLSPRRISKPQQQNNKLSKQKLLKKCQYMRPKPSYIKSLVSGRSLRSLDINHINNSHSNNKRILSHRKLISLSSIQNKNLTQRRQKSNQYQGSSRNVRLNNIHNYRFIKYNKDNQEDNINNINHINNIDNMDRALEIKENILKEFIDKFQEQLKQINQQKSSRKTLLTHRKKTQTETHRLKTQTTKKQPLIRQYSQSNNQTINRNQQKSKFQKYLKELQQNKCKDKKILVIKNPKKTLHANPNTQQLKPQQSKLANRQINLKQLFKHSSKYQPFIKDKQNTLPIKVCPVDQAKQIAVNQMKQDPVNQRKQDPVNIKQNKPFDVKELMSPINNSKQNSHYKDVQCSTIERINQSSFISQMGRNSLLQNLDTDRLKNLDTDRLKILKDQNKMSKKCLAKMKNLFPTDFFL